MECKICKICDRQFTEFEIEGGIRLPVPRGARHRLVLIAGIVHRFQPDKPKNRTKTEPVQSASAATVIPTPTESKTEPYSKIVKFRPKLSGSQINEPTEATNMLANHPAGEKESEEKIVTGEVQELQDASSELILEEGWFAGHVDYVSDGGYLFIQYDGQRYFAHFQDVTAPNGHMCLFTTGTAVYFQIHEDSRPDALKAANVCLRDENMDLPEVEISTIDIWKGTHGWARRDGCNCHIFVPGRAFGFQDVISESIRFKHRITPDKARAGRFCAVQAEIVTD